MAESLTSGYDNYLRSLLKNAKCINSAGAEQCLASKSYTFEFSDKTYVGTGVVFFHVLTHNVC